MAGRSVGRIEVVVEANTGRLKAQMVKDGEEAAFATKEAIEEELKEIRAAIDDSGFVGRGRRAAELLKTQMEAQLQGLDIGVDFTEARRDLRAFEAEAEAVDLAIGASLSERDIGQINVRLRELRADTERNAIELRIDGDLADLNARLAKMRQEQQHERVDVQFGADLAEINARLRALRAEAEANAIQLRIRGDLAGINANLEAFRQEQEHRSVPLDFDAQLKGINANLAEFRAIQEHNAIEIPITADRSQVQEALAAMEAAAKAAGTTSGSNFGSGFGSGLSTRTQLIVGAVATLAEPIAVALQGLFSAATSVVGSAFSALAGGLGAALPLLAGIPAIIGAGAIAFGGLTDGIKAVNHELSAAAAQGREFNFGNVAAALKGLAPAAQDFVIAFGKLGPLFDNIKKTVQQHVFAGLDDELNRLGTTTIPRVGRALVLAGNSVNLFARNLGAATEKIDFVGLFQGLQPAFDDLGRAVVSVVGAFQPFMQAATPAARALAAAIAGAAESLRALVQSGSESGALQVFLLRGVASLRLWAGLLREVSGVLGSVFNAGRTSGDSFVASLRDIVGEWGDFLKTVRGQNALEDFFERGRAVMSDLLPVLRGLGDGLGHLVDNTALARFGRFTDSLGEALDTLGQLLELISRTELITHLADAFNAVGDALEPVMADLEEFASNISDFLGSALAAVVPLLGQLGLFVGNLVGVFNSLAPPIQAVALALGAIVLLRGTLGGFFTGIGSTLTGLRDNLTLLRPALQDVRSALEATFSKGLDLTTMKKGIAQLGPALLAAGAGIASGAGIALASGLSIAFGLQMISEGHSMGTAITGALTIATSALTSFFLAGGGIQGTIVAGVSVAIGAITRLFQASAEEARKTKQDIKELADGVRDFFETASSAQFKLTLLTDLREQGVGVERTLRDMGFNFDDFAERALRGSLTAKDAVVDLLKTTGPAGAQLAADFAAGRISFEDLMGVLDERGGGLENVTTGFVGLGNAVKTELDAAGISTANFHDALAFVVSALGETGSALDQARIEAQLTGDAFGKGADPIFLQAQGLQAMGVSLPKVQEGLKGTGDAATTMGAAFNESANALSEFNEAGQKIGSFAERAGSLPNDVKRLASRFLALKDAAGKTVRPMSDLEQSMFNIGTAADEAATKSDELRNSFDLFINPTLDAQEALDGVREAISKVGTATVENADGTEKMTSSLNEMTEAGRENRQAVRDAVQGIEDFASAQIAAGKPVAETVAGINDLRNSLINKLLPAFAGNKQAATDYVNALLTAKGIDITTLVEQQGMDKALTDTEKYTTLLSPLDKKVINTTFQGNAPVVTQDVMVLGTAMGTVPANPPPIVFKDNAALVGQDMTTLGTAVNGVPIPNPITFTTNAGVLVQQDLTLLGTAVSSATKVPPPINFTTNSAALIGQDIALLGGAVTGIPTPPKIMFSTNIAELFGPGGQDAMLLGAAVQETHNITITTNSADVVGQIGTIQSKLTETGAMITAPQITLPTYPEITGQLDSTQGALETLDSTNPTPDVTIPTYSTTKGQIDNLQSGLTRLDNTSSTPDVSVGGYDTAVSRLDTIFNRIGVLKDKTVTITINTVGNVPQLAGGGVAGPFGAIGGEAGPEIASLRGVSRLITSPTRLAPGTTVVPLTGTTPTAGQPFVGKQINQQMTVISQSQDPVAVATQVMNRAAALASV